jgi:alkylation response protein AidB-like acyl-CoA dehydrogenase
VILNFKFSEQEEAFRKEVASFIKDLMKTELKEWKGIPDGRPSCPEDWSLYRKYNCILGQKGWLTMSWPRKYGGLERPLVEQAIANEEIAYQRAPFVGQEATFIGPTILTFGTEQQKEEYLPKIAKGLIYTCQGFSEPNAGSDLASVQTRAIEEGDHFIINGNKIFTSWADKADYCLLLARTDPKLPKHKGLSLFIVDMKSPGITIHPFMCIHGLEVLTETFWDDVRVPVGNLLGGEKNQAWSQVATCLNIERSTAGVYGGGAVAVGQDRRILDDIVEYAKNFEINGKLLAEDPMFQHKVAELIVKFEVSRLLTYNVIYRRAKGEPFEFEASAAKVFGSEFKQLLADVCLQFLGPYGQLQRGSKWVPLDGALEYHFRTFRASTIGGGTSEIQRYLIATRDCRLPRG